MRRIIEDIIIVATLIIVVALAIAGLVEPEDRYVICCDCGQTVNYDDAMELDAENTLCYICDNCWYEQHHM